MVEDGNALEAKLAPKSLTPAEPAVEDGSARDSRTEASVIYWIDGADRIIRVNEAWDAFARANGGASVVGAGIIGQSLWRYLSGDPIRMWMDAVLGLARISRGPVTRAYRCDCPEKKRFMRMVVVPEQGGVLRLEHHLLGEEPREPVYFVPWSGQGQRPLLRCSLCGRIQHCGQWIEPVPQATGPYGVIYTVCPECHSGKVHRAVQRSL